MTDPPYTRPGLCPACRRSVAGPPLDGCPSLWHIEVRKAAPPATTGPEPAHVAARHHRAALDQVAALLADNAALATDRDSCRRTAERAEGERDEARRLVAQLERDRDEAVADRDELQAHFDLQWTRMLSAADRWRQESPIERAKSMPDLGELLAWLMADRDHWFDQHAALDSEVDRHIADVDHLTKDLSQARADAERMRLDAASLPTCDLPDPSSSVTATPPG